MGTGWTDGWSRSYYLCHACLSEQDGLEVRESEIVSGELGLFATTHFEEDEFLTPYCGEKVTPEEVIARYGMKCGAYAIELDEKTSVDAYHPYLHGVGRYVNDVKPFSIVADNSARFGNFLIGPDGGDAVVSWPGLWARRDIVPGEEITVSYGKNYWTAYMKHGGKKKNRLTTMLGIFGMKRWVDYEPEELQQEIQK